jgi:hypothetical protein
MLLGGDRGELHKELAIIGIDVFQEFRSGHHQVRKVLLVLDGVEDDLEGVGVWLLFV